MRKRLKHFHVCSCSPERGVTYLDARLLKDIVNRGIHPIRCASTCGHKALRGLLLGDLCAETNHLGWALRIWKFTLKQIHEKDYDDWIDVHWFNTKYVSFQDVISNLFTFDLLLRFAFLVLAVYYVLNILLLPRLFAKKANVPRYMIGYCFAVSVVCLYYIYITVSFSQTGLIVYVILFTLINMYLTFRTLETMAINLPKPVLETVVEEPSAEEVAKAEQEDFNEANLQRFQRIQYWMQNHVEAWTESTFNRSGLCEGVGYNRHLVLQSVRSQGFNNVHDYINSYRVEHLKRQIKRGRTTTINDCLDSGFGTTKTARSCFARHEGIVLDEYLAQYSRNESES